MATPRFTITFANNLYWLNDDGMAVDDFDTKEQAEQEMKNQIKLDKVAEHIEDAIVDLKRELVHKYNITLEQAHDAIKEAL